MHLEFTPVKFAMRPAGLCIRKSKPGSGNTWRKDGDWGVERGEGKKHNRESRHSIQLPRMLWEQALLRILHAQYCETHELLSVIQVTDACDVAARGHALLSGVRAGPGQNRSMMVN